MSHATLVSVPTTPAAPRPPADDPVGPLGPVDEVTSAWLAAFALGLAYSQRPEAARQLELEEVAGGCLDALRAAHARLRSISVAEPSLQLAALRLLRKAMDAATAVSPEAATAV
jgi:hypothetical protein